MTLSLPPLAPLRSLAFVVLAVATATAGAGESAAQADRIWGTVYTTAEERYQGFILWNGPGSHDAASWADVLHGTRATNPEHYEAWLEASGRQRPVRAVELRGYRVSWNEDDPDYPLRSATGVRFGRLSAVKAPENGDVEVVLRADRNGATASPPALILARPRARSKALEVDQPGAGKVQVEWGELLRVEFAASPPGVDPSSARLHGTVEDRFGRSFTGYVAWDSDEVLESEVLDGEDHEVPFGAVRSIERSLSGARIALRSGEVVNLDGTNDVNRDNRGVRIFDPGLGTVEVEWEEFGVLRFHPPASVRDYDSFGGGAEPSGSTDETGEDAEIPVSREAPASEVHRLVGEIATRRGERIEGRVLWDAEHEWSWELLHGHSDGVKFAVEFGTVARIGRREDGDMTVSLLDGRVFELSDPADADRDHRGVFVFPDTTASTPSNWRYVAWEDFAEVRFLHAAEPFEGGANQGAGR